MSPGPLEAVFFGPQVGNSAKCGGGVSGRLSHSRQVHREICSLLLGALDALKVTLTEFLTVLPHQWTTLLGSNTKTENDINQRMKKLSEFAKVKLRNSYKFI